MTREELEQAVRSGAYLSGAYLSGANLSRANLSRAYLSRADLSRADLGAGCWVIQGPCRSDGYWFHLQRLYGETQPMVKAGCRYFTLPEAFAHWQTTRGGTKLGNETLEILHTMWNLAYHRGYINDKGEVL